LKRALSQRGIKPADLKAVILSHLHNDNAGGLKFPILEAPELPVFVGREHWKAFGEQPFFASIEGATPSHWPKEFSPKILDFEGRPVEPWRQSCPLIAGGKIIVVDTSGHVPGHISLVIHERQRKTNNLSPS
jgi:glyoxylase-like metal-dependent hydrolase (beta-lactamase superfamily II)